MGKRYAAFEQSVRGRFPVHVYPSVDSAYVVAGICRYVPGTATVTVVDLAHEWREEAQQLRRRGLDREAEMVESFADDLEARINAEAVATMSISEGAETSGYSESALYDMVQSGRVQNMGTSGRIRVRKTDLPKKPPPRPQKDRTEPDLVRGVPRIRIS